MLEEIQNGEFAKTWIKENAEGRPWFNRQREVEAGLAIEEVGTQLRSMMPWIGAGKAKPQDVSGG